MNTASGSSATSPGACLLFATADWDTPYWTNKQHTADHLAKAGWQVLYVESVGLRAPQLGSGTDWHRLWRRLVRGLRGPRRVGAGLWVLSPLVIPFKHHHPWVRAFNQGYLAWTLSRFLRRQGLAHPMVWTYHPFVLETLDRLQARHNVTTGPLVYHCVDDLAAIPGIDATAFNAEERRLLTRADAVFTTSQALFEKCAPHNPHVHDFPNVVDLEHFGQAFDAGPLPADLQAIPEPRIGYVGALSDFKVDFTLLRELAQQRPSWQFVLIGDEREGQRDPVLADMARLPNVHRLGHRPYQQLPLYLRGLAVGLLPTRINTYTRSMFPMKYFEYIASGVPVVSTRLAFTETEHSPLLQVADDATAFGQAIAAHLAAPRPDRPLCERLVAKNTWKSRLAGMLAHVFPVTADR
ncbi:MULTISPECIES: glycosyltransferase [Hydrogenophaga]|uniref:Glycosyl transferase n=1 Tax=Hydrogenophaga electricum TaxID=1230953 RepID=A0ABQ6C0I3_9BURK|nr:MULTISPECIES: glycosyltransferase [Hydrogenophaga]GLS13878.1 glycosyl transferase [Hydrogenophaga electricum]